jgi:hypothetical protein
MVKRIWLVPLFTGVVAFFMAPSTIAAEGNVAKAQSVVRDLMKDPNSVQFKEVHVVPAYKVVCGRYNAKNAYGAYTGFRLFAVDGAGRFYQPYLPPSRARISIMNEAELRQFDAQLKEGKETNAKLQEWCAPMDP